MVAMAATSHPRRSQEHTMNKLLASAIAASLALTNPAWADDAHHPEKAQEAAAPAKPAATRAGAKTEPAVQKMQANLKTMKAQLDRIAAARTDAERRQAIAEHLQTMQDNMRLAQGMAGGMMMGCPMMEGGMMGGGMMMGGGDMAERMQQMEKRMDMMQMMLERMAPRPEAPAPGK